MTEETIFVASEDEASDITFQTYGPDTAPPLNLPTWIHFTTASNTTVPGNTQPEPPKSASILRVLARSYSIICADLTLLTEAGGWWNSRINSDIVTARFYLRSSTLPRLRATPAFESAYQTITKLLDAFPTLSEHALPPIAQLTELRNAFDLLIDLLDDEFLGLNDDGTYSP